MVSSSQFSGSFDVCFSRAVWNHTLPQTFAGSIVVLDSCLGLQVKALCWSLSRAGSFPTSRVVTHSSSLIKQFDLRMGGCEELANDYLCGVRYSMDSTDSTHHALWLHSSKLFRCSPCSAKASGRKLWEQKHHLTISESLCDSQYHPMVWKDSLHSWTGICRYSGSGICHSTNLLPPDTELVVHGLRSAFLRCST